MSPIEHQGKRYKLVRGSDVQRDGMYLELWDAKKEGEQLFEAFYSDETGEMMFASFAKGDVPLEVIEEFVRQARLLLTPAANEEKA